MLGGTLAGGNLAAVLSHVAQDQGLQPPLNGLYYHVQPVGGKDFCVYPEEYQGRAVSFVQNEFAPLISTAMLEVLVGGICPMYRC